METKLKDSSKAKRLTVTDKEEILKHYNELGSIKKVCDITKWSVNTVNKIVKAESSKKPMSRDFDGKVVQKTLEGKIISEFKSISEAEKLTGIKKSNISQNVTGKTNTAGGYVWVREGIKHNG